MSRTLVLMIVFLPTLGLFGQQKDSSLNLDPVVITGQHQALSAQKSVYRVNILDRSRIEAQAANTLADLMVTELSTNLYQDPVLGSVMQLQGISGENVKILIDGVPVVGRLGGDLDLSQLPLNQVERESGSIQKERLSHLGIQVKSKDDVLRKKVLIEINEDFH